MTSVAFAYPIRPGTDDKLDEWVRELTEGERSERFHHERRTHGFKRVKAWRQRVPTDMLVVYVEADDVDGALGNRTESDTEFEDWFRGLVEDITGHHPDHVTPSSPSDLLFDWHPDEGSSRTHHPA